MERSHVGPKQRVAELLRLAPWIAAAGIWLARIFRSRFTAGVVGVILNEKEDVLLVEHVFHPDCAWGLPGGWLERGESPAQALQRELREELGLEVEALRVLLVEADPWDRSHLNTAYLCRARGEVSHLSLELLDYRWTSIEALPSMVPFHHLAVEEALRQRSEVVTV